MHILLIVGSRSSGKTSLCEYLSNAARARHFLCCGCLEISARGKDMLPYRIELVDIASRDTLLAAQRPHDTRAPFEYNPQAFSRARERCLAAIGIDSEHGAGPAPFSDRRICIIDEIGPLELKEHQGHAELLEIMLNEGPTDVLILTVRPSLLSDLKIKLSSHDFPAEKYKTIDIDTLGRDKSYNASESIFDTERF